MKRRLRVAAVLAAMLVTPAAAAEDLPEGFVSILPASDFIGWVGGKTIHPTKITPEQPTRGASKIPAHWRIEGDELVSDGHRPQLVTENQYRDFEILVDWNLAPNGDSGVYLRDTPQLQIGGPQNEAAHKHGSQKGSGGLWSNRDAGKWPLELADAPTDTWNGMRVRMVGPYVRVMLNDKLVVEDGRLENFFDRSAPMFEEGRIHRQTHASATCSRRLPVREIGPTEANGLVATIETRDDS